jgi:hypothetical protein
MAIMNFETGGSFCPRQLNGAGSGAIGLIQFMPATAAALGTTTDALAKMDDLQQLGFVEAYFRKAPKPLNTLSNLYMAVLWPAAVGKPEDYVMFRKSDPACPKLYIQNRGLDYNGDGVITKAEAAARVAASLAEGEKPENVA